MRWPGFWGSSSSSSSSDDDKKPSVKEQASTLLHELEATFNKPSDKSPDDLLTVLTTPSTYTSPSTLIPTVLLTTVLLTSITFSRRYLTRYPTASHIPPPLFRKRSLFGRVTSVGDADNFRLYHTPGGRLAGWGWLRRLPVDKKGHVKPKIDETVHVRLAGVDAPELAHWGQPAQPFGEEALAFLKKMVDGRRVRVWLWRADQYGRAVATVYVRRWFGLWKTDVGKEMLRKGMATVYEAKTGAEFGGKEQAYRRVEAKARAGKRGLWSLEGQKGFESPRQFKERHKDDNASGKGEERTGVLGKAVKGARSVLTFWK